MNELYVYCQALYSKTDYTDGRFTTYCHFQGLVLYESLNAICMLGSGQDGKISVNAPDIFISRLFWDDVPFHFFQANARKIPYNGSRAENAWSLVCASFVSNLSNWCSSQPVPVFWLPFPWLRQKPQGHCINPIKRRAGRKLTVGTAPILNYASRIVIVTRNFVAEYFLN